MIEEKLKQIGDNTSIQTMTPVSGGDINQAYIGKLSQINGWHNDWVDYFRKHRLQPQLDLSMQLHRMDLKRRFRLETLIRDLNKYLPSQSRVSLLHGDLWGGNWITGYAGKPYLIDPSILYGDRLFELAFMELFGSFSDIFYSQYKETLPVEDYYEDVKPIYQLFYLLVHLNMLGEAMEPI